MREFLSGLAMIPTGFICGILMLGLHRKIIARIQGRPGPPVQQELYHALKFFVKEITVPKTASVLIAFSAAIMIIAFWSFAIFAIFLGLTLFIEFGILVVQKLVEHAGGLSTGSPYGKFAGVRSVFTAKAELPLFGLFVAFLYMETGSPVVSDILAYQHANGPLITQTPLAFIAAFALTLSKIKYSPFIVVYGRDLVTGYQTEHYGVFKSALLTGESLMIFTWIFLLVTVFFGSLSLWAMILVGLILLISISFISGLTPLLAPHHSVQFLGSVVLALLAIKLIIIWFI